MCHTVQMRQKMEILKSNSAGLSPAYVVESEAMPWFRSSLVRHLLT